jgi:hypothetical protein
LNGGGGFDGPGLDNSYGMEDGVAAASAPGGDSTKKKRNTFVQKLEAMVVAVFGPIAVRFQALDRFERVMLAAMCLLVLVIVAILFPDTLVWLKRIVDVRKWSHWIWSGIFLVLLMFLFWLRDRYE